MHAFSDEDAWNVIEDISNDSAAALILWSITEPCRCGMRSRVPAASGLAMGSSARSTWSRSG